MSVHTRGSRVDPEVERGPETHSPRCSDLSSCTGRLWKMWSLCGVSSTSGGGRWERRGGLEDVVALRRVFHLGWCGGDVQATSACLAAVLLLEQAAPVPDSLRHRFERRLCGHERWLDWCHFRACLRFLVLPTLQHNTGATLSRDRKVLQHIISNSSSETETDETSHITSTSDIRLGLRQTLAISSFTALHPLFISSSLVFFLISPCSFSFLSFSSLSQALKSSPRVWPCFL